MDPNPNQALWEKGDFTRIATTMRESGEELVRSLGVKPGMKVLDLGCGDGTTAFASARLGADVTGVDISRNLVEACNRRAREAGLSNLRCQHGDAMNLTGIADRTFDLSMSVFGAMFAPRPLDVAKEMVRVTKKGGRVVMGNWIPNDPTMVAQLLKVSSAYSTPPPAGFISPMLWGVENDIVERFMAAGIPRERISCERNIYTFHAPMTPAAYVAAFRDYYGPTMNAFAAAKQNGKAAELQTELEALFERENESNVPGQTTISAGFMRVTVTV